MCRKSIEEATEQDQGTNLGLYSDGFNDVETSRDTKNELLSRNHRQGKTCSIDKCERIASKRGLCEKHYRRYWRSVNKEHNANYAKQYHENIRKPILQALHKSKDKICIQCGSTFSRSGSNQKFCSIKCRDRYSYLLSRDEILRQKADYYKANKKHINDQKTLYKRKRRKDPIIRLADNLRSRFNKAFKNNYKTGSAVQDLGCSIDELKLHLESKFADGMTWDNYGKWHIDHIKPLNSFNLSDLEQLKIACHYTNLQPMWAKDNLKKGDRL